MSARRVVQVGWSSIAYVAVLGVAAGWWLHEVIQPPPATRAAASSVVLPVPTAPADRPGRAAVPARLPAGDASDDVLHGDVPAMSADPVAELRRHGLQLPIDGARIEAMKGGFAEGRNGNTRGHEAVDILAPRGTPVVAVEAGTIARLFSSRAGGTTVYLFDSANRFCYYYAHLERYADGLHEGQEVSAGHVIGYVGTTGNAPPDTPHLHFAIFQLTPDERWWEGTPIDPYLVFVPSGS